MLIPRFPAPVAKSEPHERTERRDEHRPDDLHAPVNEQIPSDDADENAQTFGQRESRVGRQVQAPAFGDRGATSRRLRMPRMRLIELPWQRRSSAVAAQAPEGVRWRIELTAHISNFFREAPPGEVG